jgi:putative nucleotidyltransferase with HDIG domain
MSPLIENMDRMVRDVPAMPVVAQKVMQMLGDPRTTNTALGDTLATDMSMATRVLQMANSPFFGARQKISSISQAIFVLGHSALRSLIITVCTKGIFKNPGLMEEKIWEHSLGTAVAARCVADRSGLMDKDEAFLGGLLHDLGRLILVVVYRDAYTDIFQKAYNQSLDMDKVIEEEKEEFGYDHCEIGSRVVAKWRLPNVYARIARRHHSVNIELLNQEENPNAVAVAAQANLIAHRLGLGGAEPEKGVNVVATPYNQMLKIPEDMVLKIVEDTLRAYKEAQDQFKL